MTAQQETQVASVLQEIERILSLEPEACELCAVFCTGQIAISCFIWIDLFEGVSGLLGELDRVSEWGLHVCTAELEEEDADAGQRLARSRDKEKWCAFKALACHRSAEIPVARFLCRTYMSRASPHEQQGI